MAKERHYAVPITKQGEVVMGIKSDVSSFGPGLPCLFGGAKSGSDRNPADTLKREGKEESHGRYEPDVDSGKFITTHTVQNSTETLHFHLFDTGQDAKNLIKSAASTAATGKGAKETTGDVFLFNLAPFAASGATKETSPAEVTEEMDKQLNKAGPYYNPMMRPAPADEKTAYANYQKSGTCAALQAAADHVKKNAKNYQLSPAASAAAAGPVPATPSFTSGAGSVPAAVVGKGSVPKKRPLVEPAKTEEAKQKGPFLPRAVAMRQRKPAAAFPAASMGSVPIAAASDPVSSTTASPSLSGGPVSPLDEQGDPKKIKLEEKANPSPASPTPSNSAASIELAPTLVALPSWTTSGSAAAQTMAPLPPASSSKGPI